MSEITIRERLTRIEVLIENHIRCHDARDRWMLRIVGGLVIGMVLVALPGCLMALGFTG